MGSVVNSVQGLLGGTTNGMNFNAGQAAITNPVTQDQINSSLGTSNQAISGQQTLAQQLAGANGVQNQSQVYNQLQGIANGTGPNPALTQLNQTTAANTANQAALMAGQRGASSNAGLIARQAAQQGAANQQNAVGQAATLQAQQQLGAINSAGTLAGQQVSNDLSGQQALANSALTNQSQLLGAQQAFNSAQVSNTAQQNSANEAIAAVNAKDTAGAISGLVGGVGGAILPKPAAAYGGQVPSHLAEMQQYYHGGKVDAMVSPGEKWVPPQQAQAVAKGEKSLAEVGETIKGKAQVQGDSSKNDTKSKKLEEGGIVIPRSVMQSKDPVKEGTKFLLKALKEHGGHKEESDFHGALKKAIASRR